MIFMSNRIEYPQRNLDQISQNMSQKMCDAEAEDLRIQHGCEYGFFGEQFNETVSI